MAKDIILKGKAVSEVTSTLTAMEFSVCLDNSGVEIPAVFSIDLKTTGDVPMVGITSYGRITALAASADLSVALTVTATEMDGTTTTEVDTDLSTLLAADVGDSIAASQ